MPVVVGRLGLIPPGCFPPIDIRHHLKRSENNAVTLDSSFEKNESLCECNRLYKIYLTNEVGPDIAMQKLIYLRKEKMGYQEKLKLKKKPV